MVNSPNLDSLKKSVIADTTSINQIFLSLMNELKAYLNLEVINRKVRIYVIDELINNIEFNKRLTSYGVNRFIREGIFHIQLLRDFREFFPFLILQSAYLVFIPDNLKETNFVDFAINQFVEIDLKEFSLIKQWKSFIREKYINYTFLVNQSDKFRFDKFLELEDSQSNESPKKYFFEYLRRNPNLNYAENLHFTLGKIYEDFLFKASKSLQNNEIAETLRVLTEIFYRIKNCDTLEGFSNNFKYFKKRGIINTDLSLRSFNKNLRWINKYSFITPTYYFDWKALNIALITCYFKFNPLLRKAQIDKIINQMPFMIMPNLSVANFSIELTAYFVIPEIYIEDLKYMLEKMEQNGYLIKKICSLAKKYVFSLNLNYFRESYKNGHIINHNKKNYRNNYQLEFIQQYSTTFNNANLKLLDFLILDRIRFFSYVGINFSRRREISNIIKSDYNNFLSGENGLIKELEKGLEDLTDSPKLQEDFLNFLDRNQNFGFFYIKDELEKWVNYSLIIEKESRDTMNDFNQFKDFYEKEYTLQLIEEDAFFDIIDSNSYSFKNLFLNYLNSRDKYEEEMEKIQFFCKFLKLCYNLKIFSIKSIKKLISNLELLKEITHIKKERLRNLKKNNKYYEITSKTINLKINDFVNNNPKIVKPYLIDSIWTNSIASYFPQLILKNSPEVRVILNKMKKWFPKIYFYETTDLFNKQEYIFLQLFIPHLKNEEKILFISLLSNKCEKDIISFNRYSWNGLLQTFSRKEFYDFNQKAFFYTKDLFEQYFLYIKGIMGEELKPFKEKTVSSVKLWFKKADMSKLIDKINRRILNEPVSFKPKDLQKLLNFHLNLEKYFSNKEEFEITSKDHYFSNYIKSIKLFPAFQNFGLDQYLLYITPNDLEEIDFKMLFTNTFQKIKHIASIDSSNSLFIKYIFPFNDPNNSYLNWLRSKNKIREYCLLTIKSISQIFHFNHNLSSNGWYLDPNNYKTYILNILFNPNYKVPTSEVKHFDTSNLVVKDYNNPDSSYYKDLLHLYNWHSVDLKELLNNNSNQIFDKIHFLVRNKLIFPYVSLKNLDLKEKIQIILLNLNKDTTNILRNIFQYFNYGFVYDIEGEYYIHGFDEKIEVKNGLMIKLYLPNCELSEFLRIFEYIFQYLKVEKYLIITDLVNGDSFIKSIYGNAFSFEKYNPLVNLIWDSKAKVWMNHKLFGKSFEYLYPELIQEKYID